MPSVAGISWVALMFSQTADANYPKFVSSYAPQPTAVSQMLMWAACSQAGQQASE